MLDVRNTVQSAPGSRYHVSLAVDDSEIREAQRLRHQVFAGEMGARLSSILPGHDIGAAYPQPCPPAYRLSRLTMRG